MGRGKRICAALVSGWLAIGGPVGAQDMSDHAGHGAEALSPADAGYAVAMQRMMSATPPPTGDADRDFAAMMIPHHQAAIEMARVELEHGRDPEMRRLAEEVVQAQEAEITRLRAFLDRPPRP